MLPDQPASVAADPAPRAETLLLPAYPNPFSSHTELGVSLKERTRIVLSLHDALGRRIRVLSDALLDPGTHRFALDGRDLPPGMYECRLEARGRRESMTLMLLR